MAATVHTWTNGNADGDWNNVNNWSSGALPGSGGAGLDTAIFDGSVTNTGPSVNMDRSADAILYQIIVRDNFTGNIGGSGNYLIHSLDTLNNSQAHLLHRGTGNVYFSITAAKHGDVIMDGRGNLYLDCEATSAYINTLCIKAGTVSAASTCSLKGIVFLDGAAAILTVNAKDSTELDPLWIIIRNGVYTNHRLVTTEYDVAVLGGLLDQRGIVQDSAMVLVGPAGRLKYTPSGDASAQNPDVVLCGLLDTRASNQTIDPAQMIISQLGSLLGTAVQPGGSQYTDIDLREEYP
jgi:hypothetical protein